MSQHRYCLGMRVDFTSYEHASRLIVHWAKQGLSRYVCVANVHMVMESWDSADFRGVVNGASLVTPDGMPLVWALKALGISNPSRVYGPDLTLTVCEYATREGIPVALYGGTPDSLDNFVSFLTNRYPGLDIRCRISPPFRELTHEEILAHREQLNDSGARITFVGLGCPKQERWMASSVGLVNSIMVGVGAAFDFHSGRVKQAPALVQRMGMEWMFRLLMEPRRLWKRYFKHNPRFVLYFLGQLLGIRPFSNADNSQERI